MAYGLFNDDEGGLYKTSEEARAGLPVYGGAPTPPPPTPPRMALAPPVNTPDRAPTAPPVDPVAAAGGLSPEMLAAGFKPVQMQVSPPSAALSRQSAPLSQEMIDAGFRPVQTEQPPDPNAPGIFGSSLQSQWNSTKEGLVGAVQYGAHALGAEGAEQWAKGKGKEIKAESEKLNTGPAFTDVMEGKGSFGDWAKGIAGTTTEILAEGAATAAATALAGSVIPGAGTAAGGVVGFVGGVANAVMRRGAFKALAGKAAAMEAEKLTAAAAAKGVELTAEQALTAANTNVLKYMVIGGTLSGGKNTAVEIGSIYQDAIEESERTGKPVDMAKVLGYGLGAGFMDTMSEAIGVGKLFKVGKGAGRISNAFRASVSSSLTEGGTEGVQTILEQIGAGTHNWETVFTDPQSRKNIVNSIATGAAAGGILGGGAGAMQRVNRPEAAAGEAPAAGAPATAPGVAPTPSALPADVGTEDVPEVTLGRARGLTTPPEAGGSTARTDVAAAVKEMEQAAKDTLTYMKGPDILRTITQAKGDTEALGKGKVPAATAFDDKATTTEPDADVDAQIAALADPSHPKDSVYLAKGTPVPKVLPEGVEAIFKKDGTYLTNNPQKAAAIKGLKKITDRQKAAFLGIPESKSEVAAGGGVPMAVSAKDAQGNVVMQAATPLHGPNADAVAAQTPPGGSVDVQTIPEALAERQDKVLTGVQQKGAALEQAWGSMPKDVVKLADEAVAKQKASSKSNDPALYKAADKAMKAFEKAVTPHLPPGVDAGSAMRWHGRMGAYAGRPQAVAGSPTSPTSPTTEAATKATKATKPTKVAAVVTEPAAITEVAPKGKKETAASKKAKEVSHKKERDEIGLRVTKVDPELVYFNDGTFRYKDQDIPLLMTAEGVKVGDQVFTTKQTNAIAKALRRLGDEHAVQEQGAAGVLQREQEEDGEAGGERRRVEPKQQGKKSAEGGTEKKAGKVAPSLVIEGVDADDNPIQFRSWSTADGKALARVELHSADGSVQKVSLKRGDTNTSVLLRVQDEFTPGKTAEQRAEGVGATHTPPKEQRTPEEKRDEQQSQKDLALKNLRKRIARASKLAPEPRKIRPNSTKEERQKLTNEYLDDVGRPPVTLVETPKNYENMAQWMDKLFGQRVQFYSPTQKDTGEDGFKIPGDRETIYVNINATKPWAFIVGHEFGHNIRELNPRLWKDFEQVIIGLSNNKAYKDYVYKLKRTLEHEAKARGESRPSMAEVGALTQEEWAADAVGTAFKSPAFWDMLMQNVPVKDKPIVLRMMEEVVAMLQSLLRAAQSFVTPGVKKTGEEEALFNDLRQVNIEVKNLLVKFRKDPDLRTQVELRSEAAAWYENKGEPDPDEGQFPWTMLTKKAQNQFVEDYESYIGGDINAAELMHSFYDVNSITSSERLPDAEQGTTQHSRDYEKAAIAWDQELATAEGDPDFSDLSKDHKNYVIRSLYEAKKGGNVSPQTAYKNIMGWRAISEANMTVEEKRIAQVTKEQNKALKEKKAKDMAEMKAKELAAREHRQMELMKERMNQDWPLILERMENMTALDMKKVAANYGVKEVSDTEMKQFRQLMNDSLRDPSSVPKLPAVIRPLVRRLLGDVKMSRSKAAFGTPYMNVGPDYAFEIDYAINELLGQTDTPAFKRWFGKSKIVDKDGNPRVMWHGTSRIINEFRGKQANAIFLTDDLNFAEDFAHTSTSWMKGSKAKGETTEYQRRNAKPRMYPLYVKAEFPFDYDNKKQRDLLQAVLENYHANEDGTYDVLDIDRNIEKMGIDQLMREIQLGIWTTIESPIVQEAILDLGHDAFYMKEAGRKNLAVYNATQVKSAIGNSGEFNPENPDIRQSRSTLGKAENNAEAKLLRAIGKYKPTDDPTLIPLLDKGAKLHDFEQTPRGNQISFAKAIQARARAILGRPLDIANEGDRAQIATMMAREIKAGLKRKANSAKWFRDHLEAGLKRVADVYPEVGSNPTDRSMFTLALAITSNGNDTDANVGMAFETYAHYRDKGKFLVGGNGREAQQMVKAFQAANDMIERYGPELFSHFLNTKYTAAQMGRMGVPATGELADTIVHGSAMFGPKVGGAFYQNLNENYDPVTLDRWFMRTIGRLTGALLNEDLDLDVKQASRFREELRSAKPDQLERWGITKEEVAELDRMTDDDVYPLAQKVHKAWANEDYDKKTELSSAARTWDESPMNDQPTGGTHRNNIRDTVAQALKLVNRSVVGEKILPGDVQAILWFPEKDLYAKHNATSTKGEPNDYDKAVERFLGTPDGQKLTARSGGTAGVRSQQATERGGVRQASLTEAQKRKFARAEVSRELSLTHSKYDAAVSPYQSPRAYRGRGGEGVRANVRADDSFLEHVIETYTADQKYVNAMEHAGIATPPLHELAPTHEAAMEFRERVLQAMESQGPMGQHITVYDPVSTRYGIGYDAMRMFLTQDGKAGFAITPEGEIVSVFKTLPKRGEDNLKSVAISMMHAATQMGGRWLSTYDTFAADQFAAAGFHATAQMPFNPEYAPAGWNEKEQSEWNGGKPDVVWMTYSPGVPEAYDKSHAKQYSRNGYDRAEAHAKDSVPETEPVRKKGRILFSRKDLLNPVEVYALKGDKIVGMATYNAPAKAWFVFKALPGGDIREDYTEAQAATTADAIDQLREKGVRLVRRKETTFDEGQHDVWGKGPDALFDIDTSPKTGTNIFTKAIDATLKKAGYSGPNIRAAIQSATQDSFLDVRRLQEDLQGKGGIITIANNLYQKITLFSGKTGAKLDEFKRRFVEPMEEQIEKALKKGATLRDIEQFLVAQHAQERNEFIEQRTNGDKVDGSGMTTKEAKDLLKAAVNLPYHTELQAIGKIADDVSEFKVDLMEKSGLIDAEDAAGLRRYKHYRPLKGRDPDDTAEISSGIGVGAGFSGKASLLRYALGRDSESSNTISHMLLDAEAKIVRAGKNEVTLSLAELAKDHPDPKFWVLNPQKARQTFDPETGAIRYQSDNGVMNPNVLTAFRNGRAIQIELKQDQFAQMMSGANMAGSNAILETARSVNKFLAMLMTTLNPEWSLINAARDAQTAYFNIASDKNLPPGMGKAVVKEILALKGHRDILKALKDPSNPTGLGKWYQELESMGGITKFFGLETLEDRALKLKKMEDRLLGRGGVKGKVRDFYEKSHAKGIVDWLEDANASVEAVPRVAAYKVLVEAGWSKEDAADYAKNLTVNFNRKGSNAMLSSLYLFFNPAVQGTARLWQAIQTPQGKAIAVSLFGMGFVAGLTGNAGGDDDKNGIPDYQQLSDWDRATNLIPFAHGPKIPLPYGWNAFYAAGNYMADTFFGRSVQDAVYSTMKAGGQAFNPLGGGSDSKSAWGSAVKMVSPTAIDPMLALAMNENTFGSKIAREQDTRFGPKQPDSAMGSLGSSKTSRFITSTLNSVTGGSAAKAGGIDVNPDTIDFIAATLLPGLPTAGYKFFDTGVKLATGERTETKNYPFVRRVLSEPSKGKVYEELQEAKQEIGEFQNVQKRGDYTERTELSKTHPGWAGVAASFDGLGKMVSDLQKRKAGITDGKIKVADQTTEMNRIDDRIEALNNRMLKTYIETKARW